MATGAFSGLVGGIFEGMDWREGRDDRKRRRKIEDERQDWDRESQSWKRSDQGYRVKQQARGEKEAAYQENITDEERRIWRDGGGVSTPDAAKPEAPPAPGETAPATPPVEAAPQPATVRRNPYDTAPGVIGAATLPPSDTMGPPMPVRAAPRDVGPPMPGQPPVEPSFEEWQAMDRTERHRLGLPESEIAGQWHYRNRDGGWNATQPAPPQNEFMPDAQKVDPSQPQITDVDPNRSAMVQDIQQWLRTGDVDGAANKIASDLMTGKYGRGGAGANRAIGGVIDYMTDTPENAAANAAERDASKQAAEWYQSDAAKAHFRQNPATLQEAASDPVAYAAKAAQSAPAQAQTAPAAAPVAARGAPVQTPPAPQGIVDAMPGLLRGEGMAPAGAAPAAPAAAAGGGETLPNGTPNPSVDVAAQAMAEAPGVVEKTGGKPSDAQIGSATDRLMEHVTKNVAPKLMEFYTKTGQIEKATAFAAFLDDAKVKGGMKKWSAVVTAASMGDEDGFTSAVRDAYNAPGYYDDGYTAMDARLTKDKDGNTSGAVVKFKNDETGETFEKVYQDVGDLYGEAVRILSPEAVFEQGYKSHQEAVAAEQATAKAKAVAKAAGLDWKTVMDTVDKLGSSSLSFGQLSAEEQVAKAIDLMRGESSTGGLPASSAPPGVKFGLGEIAVLR